MSYAISFDFWNTLYANGNEEKRQKLRLKFFRKFVLKYKDLEIEAIGSAFAASTQYFIEIWQNDHRTPTAEERIVYMADYLGVDLNQIEIDRVAEYFGNLIFTVRPQSIESVTHVIPQLAGKYPLGIISDTGYISGKFIRRFLKKEKLLSYFSSLVFSDEHPNSKPHSSVFSLTSRNLKISRTNLIHIGDLERTDVLGIKNAGCVSIKFTKYNRDPYADSRADYYTDNYLALLNLIESIVTN